MSHVRVVPGAPRPHLSVRFFCVPKNTLHLRLLRKVLPRVQACDCYSRSVLPRSTQSIRLATEADLPALAKVRIAAWHHAYRHIIPAAELQRVTVSSSHAVLERGVRHRPRQVLVATHHGHPVGYAIVGPQLDRRLRCLGEIYELYLHPDHQGRGLGRELLTAALWHLVESKLNPAMVWVLTQNPARHFYAACGAQLVARDSVTFGRFSSHRLAFAWTHALPLPGGQLSLV